MSIVITPYIKNFFVLIVPFIGVFKADFTIIYRDDST
jgi:hypothetical protein